MELKNTSGFKWSLDWINSRFEQIEESIRKFEYGQCRLFTLKNEEKKNEEKQTEPNSTVRHHQMHQHMHNESLRRNGQRQKKRNNT